MNSKTIKKYKDIAHLNREAFMFLSFLNMSTGSQEIINQNIVILSIPDSSDGNFDETEEWTGFVQTMKIFIKKQLAYTN